jgi:hypothetical protein
VSDVKFLELEIRRVALVDCIVTLEERIISRRTFDGAVPAPLEPGMEPPGRIGYVELDPALETRIFLHGFGVLPFNAVQVQPAGEGIGLLGKRRGREAEDGGEKTEDRRDATEERRGMTEEGRETTEEGRETTEEGRKTRDNSRGQKKIIVS